MHGLFDGWMRMAWDQCWQVTLLILAVGLVVRFAARNRPHLASVLWLVVLIKCVTPPVWSSPSSVFSWLQQPQSSPRDVIAPDAAPFGLGLALQEQAGSNGEVVVRIDRSTLAAESAVSNRSLNKPYAADSAIAQFLVAALTWNHSFMAIWLLGCLGFAAFASLRGLLCWRRLHRAGYVDHPPVTELAASLSQRLGLRRSVRVLVSRSPVGPAVIGFWRPTVVLPALIVDATTVAELEPLLAHEMIHVRRGDSWVGLLQLVTQGLWWFHPLVRWVNRLMTREAERCCDEAVIAYLGCDPARYARSLIDVLALKRTLQPVPVFPGVRPVDVTSQRLERIMKLGQGCRKQTPRWCWLVMLLAVSATLPGAAFIAAEDKPVAVESPLEAVPLAVDFAFPVGPAKATSGSNVSLRLYDLGELVRHVKTKLGETDAGARQFILARLKQALQPTMESPASGVNASQPKKAADAPKSSEPELVWDNNKLVVRASGADLAKIRKQLSELEKNEFEQIVIETRVITGPAAAIQQIPARWSGLEPPAAAAVADLPLADRIDGNRGNQPAKIRGHAQTTIEKPVPVTCALADEGLLRQIVDKAQADARTNILFAPKVTVFNGQQATIEDSMQRPFVVGHQPGEKGSSPVISVIKEGWFLTVIPRTIDEGNIRLNLSLDKRELRSVETAKVPASDKQPELTIQIPELAATKIQTLVELKPGQNLIIGGMQTHVPTTVRRGGAHAVVPEANPREPLLIVVSVRKLGPASEVQPTAAVAPETPLNLVEQAAGTDAVPPPIRKDVWKALASKRFQPKPVEDPEKQSLETRVYNVADLVIPIQDAGLIRPGNNGAVAEPDRADPKVDFAPLTDLIHSTIAPESWDQMGGRGSLRPFPTTLSLVIRQTQAVHEEISGLLSQIRTLQDLQLVFAVEPVKVTQADYKTWLDRVDAPAKQLLISKPGRLAVPLTGPDAKSLRRLGNGADSVPAMKLTLMNGQQGELQVAKEDAREEGVIAWLQLLPSIMPELQRVRLNVAAGLSEKHEYLEKRSELVTLNHGESLLVDIAADSWPVVDVSRPHPVIAQIPYAETLLRAALRERRSVPTHRQFYLFTPKVLLVREVEDSARSSGNRQ